MTRKELIHGHPTIKYISQGNHYKNKQGVYLYIVINNLPECFIGQVVLFKSGAKATILEINNNDRMIVEPLLNQRITTIMPDETITIITE